MLFGWADRQAGSGNAYWAPRWGLYRQNGGYGADVLAPIGQDQGVRNVIQEIRGYVGTFCIGDSGATFPWDMVDGWRYLSGRSGTSLRAGWNSLGIHQDWLRDRARDSIKYRGTPAVIGTGWLSHYPMAYGYAYQERTVRYCVIFCWTDTVYDRWFYVNQGWGGSGNEWVSASTWFAGEIFP
ncbi:MAG TPA: hypothetical protein VFB77_10035 [Acidimicrobiales bacterium]|nr:hypothetical protein [Acidimicrobiales bacterium]